MSDDVPPVPDQWKVAEAMGAEARADPAAGRSLMIDPIPTARNIVAETIELRDGQTVEPYVVWFCYILGGWKALLSTPIDDGRYYEVTYDRAKGRTYIDTYLKESNEEIPDVLPGEPA